MSKDKTNKSIDPNTTKDSQPIGKSISSVSLGDLEQRYREIFESASDGLLVADLETKKLILANSSFIEMLEYGKDEILDMSVMDIHPPERLSFVMAQFEKQVKMEIKTAKALPVMKKDGTVFYADVTSLPITINSRKCMLGIFRDISERLNLEENRLSALEALDESELKYRSLAESSQDAIFVIGSDDSVEYVNTYAAACFGCKPEDITGCSRTKLFPPEVAKHQAISLEHVFSTGQSVTREGPIKYPQREIWGTTMLVPIMGKGDVVKSVMGVSRDITIRKREEKYREMLTKILEALNRSGLEDALHDILTAIQTTTDVDAIAIRMKQNEDFPYLITKGFPEDFLKSENSVCSLTPLGEFCRDCDGKVNLECLCGIVLKKQTDSTKSCFTDHGSFWTNNTSDLVKSKGCFDQDIKLRNQCNTAGFESVTLIPISNQEKEVLGLLQLNGRKEGCFSPELITFLERATASIAIAMHKKQIENEKEMIGAQLRQSQKMEAIGRLVNSIAHDFNNIIAVVKGDSELLLSSLEKTPVDIVEASKSLKAIISASDRSTALTKQLIEFSKPHNPDEEQLVDFCEIIRNMKDIINRLVDHRIILNLTIPEEKLMVKISPEQIEQVVINLVVNARDAMPDGGKLEIKASRIITNKTQNIIDGELLHGNYILLYVKDTGCGMTPDLIDKIYEPFFSTKPEDKGSGLGLSTVYGIVKQNKGHIELESQVNNGTVFKIYFPEFN
jgi:PAS domain S-box-containing protein